MGYGNKIFQAACQELERRKRQAEELADRGRERFYEQCPRAREIREEMAQNAAGAAKAVLSGGDVRAEISRMKDRGLALKAEFNQLLDQLVHNGICKMGDGKRGRPMDRAVGMLFCSDE